MSAGPSRFAALRELLDTGERQIVVMREQPERAAEMVRLVDEGRALLSDLQEQGIDVRAEESRVQALYERLLREAGRVRAQARAAGAEAALADSPTWQAISETAERRRRASRRRLITIGAVVLVVGLLLFVVIPWIFPPKPIANLNGVERASASGDFRAALAEAKSEHQRVPDDPNALLWIGALQQKLGDQQAAQQAYQQAQALTGDDPAFLMQRGTILAQLGELDAAEAEARTLIARPDGAAYGQMLLGQVREVRGDIRGAISAYEAAAKLSDQSGNDQLTVIARMRLGVLMQSNMLAPTPTP